MKLGIVGLPNVGKSTLFNAITNAGAQSANYPFCTIDPNVGVVSVPDVRLDELTRMYNPAKTTPAVIEFVDIAGLVKGASKGEGLGNKFLANIREVDAIVHVVRCFENDDIVHVEGSIDPLRDIETINLELIFSDMEMLERRIDRTAKALKGDKGLQTELDFFKRVYAVLEEGKPARSVECTPEEAAMLSTVSLLTAKPVIYAANLSEADFTGGSPERNPHFAKVEQLAAGENAEVLPICAQLEADIADMEEGGKDSVPLRTGSRAFRPGSADSKELPPAGAHLLSDGRAPGGAGLDHHPGDQGPPGGRENPYRFRARFHPGGDYFV